MDAPMTDLAPIPNDRPFHPAPWQAPIRWILLLFVFLLAQCVSGAQFPPPHASEPAQEYTLTLNTNLVLLSATVVDHHNALVAGLDKDNFHIYEDGVLEPIKHFSHQDIPVTAGILVDNSSSMGPKRADVIAAAMAFARSSNPQDQMFVVNFNDNISFGLPPNTPFTDRPEILLKALSTIHTAGQTALYDGIAAALTHLTLGNREKKVLILITDGDDTASRLTLSQILAMARQSSAILYAVGIFDGSDPDESHRVLNRLTRETGGEAFFPVSSGELASICESIARDIRNQYTLAYVPTIEEKPATYRAIQVKASAPGHAHLTVRTRAGYTVPSTPPPSAPKAIRP